MTSFANRRGEKRGGEGRGEEGRRGEGSGGEKRGGEGGKQGHRGRVTDRLHCSVHNTVPWHWGTG